MDAVDCLVEVHHDEHAQNGPIFVSSGFRSRNQPIDAVPNQENNEQENGAEDASSECPLLPITGIRQERR